MPASPRSASDRAQRALSDVLREIDSAMAEATAKADAEIRAIRDNTREQTKALRGRRREVERALVALTGRPARVAASPDSRIIAGPQAIEDVRAYLEKKGQAFQADITKETGLNSGTVTHALRALAADSLIEATGERRGNSPEYRYLGAKTTSRRREPVAA